ncbi:MAG: acyl-CoA thioesterase [Lachnospiraceae bacterium]
MEYRRKVFYYETDQMGIVHHSNYIRWFEEARIDWLEKVNYPYARIEKEGVISPVLGVECEYRSMVHFGDTVIVDVQIEEFKNIKYSFSYVVRDAKDGQVRCVGKSRHCFLNKEGKPVMIKKECPELYEIFTSLVKDRCL